MDLDTTHRLFWVGGPTEGKEVSDGGRGEARPLPPPAALSYDDKNHLFIESYSPGLFERGRIYLLVVQHEERCVGKQTAVLPTIEEEPDLRALSLGCVPGISINPNTPFHIPPWKQKERERKAKKGRE